MLELDNIKLRTTWNDAAECTNTNFAKINIEIEKLKAGGGVIIDSTLTDESTNPVTSKGIKEYVDALVATLVEDIIANPQNYISLKTINGEVLFGTGDIVIQGGGGSVTGLGCLLLEGGGRILLEE